MPPYIVESMELFEIDNIQDAQAYMYLFTNVQKVASFYCNIQK